MVVMVAAVALVCPAVASAQCEGVSVVPDGRIYDVDPTVTDKYAWFYLNLGRSYSVEVSPARA
jgi:hypothetical protein